MDLLTSSCQAAGTVLKKHVNKLKLGRQLLTTVFKTEGERTLHKDVFKLRVFRKKKKTIVISD